MAGENTTEENIAGRLYGAPFLLGHKDESSFNDWSERKDIRTYNILTEGEGIFNAGIDLLKERTRELKETEETNEWYSISQTLKRRTIEPFGSEKDLEDFLKKVNENLVKINESEILKYVTKVLDSATSDAYNSKNFKDMAIERLKKEKKKVDGKNSVKLLKKKSEEIANTIASGLSGNKMDIEKIKGDNIYRYFFQNKKLFEGIASYSRKGGTAGELVDTFVDALAFSLAKNGSIPDITNKEIKKIVKSTGLAGEKRDVTYFYSDDIAFHISIKNYPSLARKALKKSERTEKEEIEVQSTAKFANFLNYIGQQLDPPLLNNQKLLQQFTEYWANISYGYHYSPQLTDKDKQIREAIDEYITSFAASFIIIGTKGKKNTEDSYNVFIHYLLSNGNTFPALFFQFSGLGIIPSYELIDACSKYVKNLEQNAARLKIDYYTNIPLQKVDKMSDGTSNGNLVKKGNGVAVRKGTLRYYGTIEEIKNGRNVDDILIERFNKFVGEMSVKISLEIISESLYTIFRKYGVGGSNSTI